MTSEQERTVTIMCEVLHWEIMAYIGKQLDMIQKALERADNDGDKTKAMTLYEVKRRLQVTRLNLSI